MDQLAEALFNSLSRDNADADTAGLREQVSSTLARAARIAPCLKTDALGEGERDAAKAILLDVMQRRLDLRGTRVLPGVATTRTRGDRSVSTDGKGLAVALFLPDEITELQALCQAASSAEPEGAGLPIGNFPPAPKWPC